MRCSKKEIRKPKSSQKHHTFFRLLHKGRQKVAIAIFFLVTEYVAD